VDALRAERWPNDAGGEDGQGDRQRAGIELAHDTINVFEGHLALNDAFPAPDGALDDRRGQHNPVEGDGEVLPDMVVGELAKLVPAVRLELEADHRAVALE